MNNKIDEEIVRYVKENYNGKGKEMLQAIKEKFGYEMKPESLYNLAKILKVSNKNKIGCVRIRTRYYTASGQQEKRAFVKIGQNKWVQRNRYVWEQHFGKIPKGMFVIHLDGNFLNDDIGNLGLVTKSQSIYIGHNELRFTNREELKAACLLSDFVSKKPHWIRPSRRKKQNLGDE